MEARITIVIVVSNFLSFTVGLFSMGIGVMARMRGDSATNEVAALSAAAIVSLVILAASFYLNSTYQKEVI